MSRTVRIKGPGRLRGQIRLPGDKSISHRVAILASAARGASSIKGFASSADCRATLDCLERLGVELKAQGAELVIRGRGLQGYRPATEPVRLEAENSGSTMRMLSGLLAGQRLTSILDGDASLRRRPMERIIEPLRLMGAQIEAREGKFAPLTIRGGKLEPICFEARVPSAQVKTCVLLAGLCADGKTVYLEPVSTRDHTERMLAEFGAGFERREAAGRTELVVEGGSELSPVDYHVPADVSSAAFFLAAAASLPDSEIELLDVNLNPTRRAFIDVLRALGASIEVGDVAVRHSEPVGTVWLKSDGLSTGATGLRLRGEVIPNLIDELPMLAVLATQVEGCIEVRDAKELRVKESDRIRTTVEGVRALGGKIEELEDGFAITGPQRLRGGRVVTAGDHRIAMAFSIAGLMAEGETEILDADCAKVSFPEFYRLLSVVAGPDNVEA